MFRGLSGPPGPRSQTYALAIQNHCSTTSVDSISEANQQSMCIPGYHYPIPPSDERQSKQRNSKLLMRPRSIHTHNSHTAGPPYQAAARQ